MEPASQKISTITSSENFNGTVEIGAIVSRGYQSAGALQAIITTEDSSHYFVTFRGSENSITIPIRK